MSTAATGAAQPWAAKLYSDHAATWPGSSMGIAGDSVAGRRTRLMRLSCTPAPAQWQRTPSGLYPTPRGIIRDRNAHESHELRLAASVWAASEGLQVATLDAACTGGQIGTTSRLETTWSPWAYPDPSSPLELPYRLSASIRPSSSRKELSAITARTGRRWWSYNTATTSSGAAVIIVSGVLYRRLN